MKNENKSVNTIQNCMDNALERLDGCNLKGSEMAAPNMSLRLRGARYSTLPEEDESQILS